MSVEIPTSWHTVFCGGICVFVDAETRLRIESWVADTDAPMPTLDVTTIAGEFATLIRERIWLVVSSTPETRAWDRAHTKLLAEEVPIEERE